MLVAQSCRTHCDPMDWSLPSSSVHGILQAKIPEWLAIPFSRRSYPLKRLTSVSHVAGRFFTIGATREALWWRRYFKWQWSHTWNTRSHVFHFLASVFESNSFPLCVNNRCFPPFFCFFIFALQNIVGIKFVYNIYIYTHTCIRVYACVYSIYIMWS